MQQKLDNHLCETIHFLKRGNLGIEGLRNLGIKGFQFVLSLLEVRCSMCETLFKSIVLVIGEDGQHDF